MQHHSVIIYHGEVMSRKVFPKDPERRLSERGQGMSYIEENIKYEEFFSIYYFDVL